MTKKERAVDLYSKGFALIVFAKELLSPETSLKI